MLLLLKGVIQSILKIPLDQVRRIPLAPDEKDNYGKRG